MLIVVVSLVAVDKALADYFEPGRRVHFLAKLVLWVFNSRAGISRSET